MSGLELQPALLCSPQEGVFIRRRGMRNQSSLLAFLGSGQDRTKHISRFYLGALIEAPVPTLPVCPFLFSILTTPSLKR